LVVGRCKFCNDYFRNGCAATQNSCATKTNKNNAARLAVVLHDNDRLSLACWMASVARTLANITVFYRGSYRWMGIIFAGPPSAGNTATIWLKECSCRGPVAHSFHLNYVVNAASDWRAATYQHAERSHYIRAVGAPMRVVATGALVCLDKPRHIHIETLSYLAEVF